MICLNLFDYICEMRTQEIRNFNKRIVVAGNLSIEKNPHILRLHELNDIQFHLFGDHFSEECSSKNINEFGLGTEKLEQNQCLNQNRFTYFDYLCHFLSSDFSLQKTNIIL